MSEATERPCFCGVCHSCRQYKRWDTVRDHYATTCRENIEELDKKFPWLAGAERL